jgi:hypothetical protein
MRLNRTSAPPGHDMTEAHSTTPSTPVRTDEADCSVRVMNIVAKGRSGSTLIAVLLGQLPGFVDVGELRYLCFRRLAKEGNVLGGCPALLRECPF